MALDLLIPFLILIILVIYLIYTRNRHEQQIVSLYEKKFEEWKDNSDISKKEQPSCKELVGLVYKQDHKIQIELLDDSAHRLLEKGKFNIKVK